jgi:hypothetical protein
MSANAFIAKTDEPTDRELEAALGPAKAVWDQWLADLASEHGANGREWKCYSPKTGWALRVHRKARTVVWLVPCEKCFTVLFILGGKAMQEALHLKLSPRIVDAINEARKYPEGTGVRLQVKSPKDIGSLKKLAAIKLAN